MITDNLKMQQNHLAERILRQTGNTLLVNLRFMDMALNQFTLVPLFVRDSAIMTDGKSILYHAETLLKQYKKDVHSVTHMYLHMVLHCVFSHFFVGIGIDRRLWDLSCDIAVENLLDELDVPCVRYSRPIKQKWILNDLRRKLKLMTAEKIHHYFRKCELSDSEIDRMSAVFHEDSHDAWYIYKTDVSQSERQGSENREEPEGSDLSSSQAVLASQWKEIAQSMQMDLESFAKRQGDKAGSLMQNLKAVTREKHDYTAFLRKFAVLGEAMKINDDEFDYVFYTYGLKLYGNMPLIEPLEYKEVKRIKEFVIAIDTSGSVAGELVQTFLQKTYNILKQEESFFTKINLHIIQCDAAIQHDQKITNQQEFDEYLANFKLFGFGGTDFRPVFEYVEKLRNEKELNHLKGLIYFTDGYGTFPEKMPDYHAAFVFVQEDYELPKIPVWAIRLVLSRDEI